MRALFAPAVSRALAALLAPLALLACGPKVDGPFTDSRIPPSLEPRFLPPEGWAWGLVQVGDAPPIRYGVAAPPVRPVGDVLIVAGYGESAEAWFETANTLVAKGYAVWIMDSAAQGGSGRYARPRDLAHVPDLTAEADGIRAVAAIAARPVVVVAQSTAAPSALTAVSRGLRPAAVVLSAPVFAATDPPIKAGPALAAAQTLAHARLGWLRAAGQTGWSSAERPPHGRPGVIAAWQGANPDLRMGGASYGWIAAFDRQARALSPQRLKGAPMPVVILLGRDGPGQGRAGHICAALPACTLKSVPSGHGSLHLEGDAAYADWNAAVEQVMTSAFPTP